MPPAENKGGDDLRFSLWELPQGGYLPCDTIVGSLIRSTKILAPDAIITLSLTGRAKTKLTKKKHVYRNSRLLVNTGPRVIFKGPLHLADGSKEPLSWSFAVGIPLEPTTCRTSPGCEVSLFPMDQEHPGHHLLPATFVSRDPAFGEPAMCFVEYYLTAHLHYVSTRHSESSTAVSKIIVRHPLEPILSSPNLSACEVRRQIQSYHLVPGMENAPLSFRQKMKTIFESSKVPEIHLDVCLKVPDVIQLDSTEPFPLVVEARPQIDRTCDKLKDDMPYIIVADVRMVLKENTYLIAGDICDKCHGHFYYELVELGLSHAFRQLESPIIISTAAENPSVNIGSLFGLVLHQSGLASHQKKLTQDADIHPDFMTYNIRRTHEVGWQVTIVVAGKSHQVKFNSVMRIIAGPSRTQNLPSYPG